MIQKGNIRYWGRGTEAEDICHLKWQLDELQAEQGKEGKNMQGKKMRRGELKEYRAGFFRSVGLIYAFTPSLAYKHPWKEEPALLSLVYSPVSTTLGKSAWQQHLRAAVGLSRRWFSKGEVNHGDAFSLPASQGLGQEQQQPGEGCALPWAQGCAQIRALQRKTLCKDWRTPRSVPLYWAPLSTFTMTWKIRLHFLLWRPE